MITDVIMAGLAFITLGLFIAAAFAFKMEQAKKRERARRKFRQAALKTWQERRRRARPLSPYKAKRIFLYIAMDLARRDLDKMEAI